MDGFTPESRPLSPQFNLELPRLQEAQTDKPLVFGTSVAHNRAILGVTEQPLVHDDTTDMPGLVQVVKAQRRDPDILEPRVGIKRR